MLSLVAGDRTWRARFRFVDKTEACKGAVERCSQPWSQAASSPTAVIAPGHPLFEAVVHHTLARFRPSLAQGAVLRDPEGEAEGLVWLLVGTVEDGLGRVAGRKLFAVSQSADGQQCALVSPARLLDFEPATGQLPANPAFGQRVGEADRVVDWSLDHMLDPYLAHLRELRRKETDIIRDYMQRSFDVLVARSQGRLMGYERKALKGADMDLRIWQERRHLEDLQGRQNARLAQTDRAAMLSLAVCRRSLASL